MLYNSAAASKYAIVVALVLLLAMATMFPLPVEVGSGGRYVLHVVKELDGSLFVNDEVVNALYKFHTIYYRGVGALGRMLGFDAEMVKELLQIIRLVMALMTVLVIAVYGKRRESAGFFVVATSAIMIVPWSASVGGAPFVQVFPLHSQAAFVLCIVAAEYASRRKYYVVGSLIGVAIFFHSLGVIQLWICLAFYLAVSCLYSIKRTWPVIVIPAVFIMLYYSAFGGLNLTLSEQTLLVVEKASMVHTSLTHQDVGSVIELLLSIAVITGMLLRKGSLSLQQAALARLAGYALLLGVSITALGEITNYYLIVLFQPMRMFSWVQVFILLIAVLEIERSYGTDGIATFVSILIIISGVVSIAAVMGLMMALSALLLCALDVKDRNIYMAVAAMAALYVLLFIILHIKSSIIPIRYFKNPVVLVLVLASGILGLGFAMKNESIRQYTALLAVLLSVMGTFIHHSWYYDKISRKSISDMYSGRDNNQIRSVGVWVRRHTAKLDEVLVAGAPDNIRAYLYRPVRGDLVNALVWIDPKLYADQLKTYTDVQKCKDSSVWSIRSLRKIAEKRRIGFIITEGRGDDSLMLKYSNEKYNVYRVRN